MDPWFQFALWCAVIGANLLVVVTVLRILLLLSRQHREIVVMLAVIRDLNARGTETEREISDRTARLGQIIPNTLVEALYQWAIANWREPTMGPKPGPPPTPAASP